MKRIAMAVAFSLLSPGAAHAATTVVGDGSTLIIGSGGTPYEEMVHNNGAAPGVTLTLDTKSSGYLVNYTSGQTLTPSGPTSGNGYATVTGPFSWLTIDPLSPLAGFSAIKFSVAADGKNNLNYLFDLTVNYLGGTSYIFNNMGIPANNNFDLFLQSSGSSVISSIKLSDLAVGNKAYNFSKIYQVSFDPTLESEVPTPSGGVPEPATWAMMVLGFGVLGAGMRRRRNREARVKFNFA